MKIGTIKIFLVCFFYEFSDIIILLVATQLLNESKNKGFFSMKVLCYFMMVLNRKKNYGNQFIFKL